MFEGGSMTGRVTPAEVQEVSDALAVLVARLEPDEVPLPEAFPLWEQIVGVSRLAAAASTLLVRRVDESSVWSHRGFRNVDDFLAHHGGTTPSDAKRRRQASERLKDLDETAAAFRRGELSEEQARVISDAATAAPEVEQKLLDESKQTPLRDLQEEAKRVKAAADPDPEDTHRRHHRNRKARWWVDAEQAFHLHANASTLDGQPLRAAIDRICDDLFHSHRTTGQRVPREALAFDALRLLAEHYLNGGSTSSSTDGSPLSHHGDRAESPGTADRKRHGRLKYQAVIRLDLDALVRGAVEGEELCEITGLGPIPVRHARRLLGESVLHLVITRGVDVQHVTYLGRGANSAQKIALLWAQPQCTNIACPNTLLLEDDHRDPYASVRCTELGNLDRTCNHCHDLKTYKGWAFVAGTGRRAFVPPTDPRHPRHSADPPMPEASRGRTRMRPGQTPAPRRQARAGARSDQLFPLRE